MVQVERGPVRYLRAGILGLSVGLVSLLGHLLGHGSLPLMAILQVLGLAVAAGGALTGRRLRLQVLVPFVAGFQVAAHWLLGRMSPMNADHPTAGAGTAHGVGHVPLATHLSGRDALVDPGQLDLAGGFWPQFDFAAIGGHVIAGAIIVLLATRADAAIFVLATALARAGRVLLAGTFWSRPVPVTSAPRPMALVLPTIGSIRLCALPSWLTRGPPAAATAA